MLPNKNNMKNALIRIKEKANLFAWRKAAAISITIVVLFMEVLSAVLLMPRIIGMRVYAVATGSMEPAYAVGSLVFTKTIETETIKVGDCITYQFGSETITHRVVRIENKSFITQGDKNQFEDPPVAYSNLIGKTAEFSLPFLGYFVIWAHQINIQAVLVMGGCAVLATGGRKLYLTQKERRKGHEAQC